MGCGTVCMALKLMRAIYFTSQSPPHLPHHRQFTQWKEPPDIDSRFIQAIQPWIGPWLPRNRRTNANKLKTRSGHKAEPDHTVRIRWSMCFESSQFLFLNATMNTSKTSWRRQIFASDAPYTPDAMNRPSWIRQYFPHTKYSGYIVMTRSSVLVCESGCTSSRRSCSRGFILCILDGLWRGESVGDKFQYLSKCLGWYQKCLLYKTLIKRRGQWSGDITVDL
jgi:hypothetical protein